MAFELLDPTGQTPQTGFAHAPRLGGLDGLRIGLLSNGKVNADRLLRMTAEHFVANHGCEIVCDTSQAERVANRRPAGAAGPEPRCGFPDHRGG